MFDILGDLMKEEEVLDWLRKNRYRYPELNIFMYALTAISGAFILHTLFLIFCMKGEDKSQQQAKDKLKDKKEL